MIGVRRMKRKFKGLLVGTLMVTMCAGLVGCSGGNQKDTPATSQPDSAKETLKVGMECAYAPFNWTQQDDSNGAVQIQGENAYANGYDVQIAKKVAESLGKELVVVKTAWDGLIPAVDTGVIDVVMAGMSPTEDRKVSVDFSDNYYKSDLVMVVKKDGSYANATALSDFSGAKITGQLNTFHYSVVDQIEGVDKQTAMEDFSAMRVALKSGVIDGYVSERPEGISASSAIDEFTFVEFADGQGFVASDDDVAIAAATKKVKEGDNVLRDQINEALAHISEEERLQIMDDAIANQPEV